MLGAVSTSSPNVSRWRSVFRALNLVLTVAFGGVAAAVFHFGRNWSWASAVVGGLVVIGLFLMQDAIKAWLYANDHD
jgi:cytochrome bd-type quinol oxidase subunit 1